MKFKLPGSFKTAEDLRARLAELGLDVELVDALGGSTGPLAQPIEWAPGRVLGNRFAVHPMEGWDGTRDGSPSELTLRRWRRFGRSGAALIWGGEAFAVRPDGRANPHQLHLEDDTREARERAVRDLSALRAEV
ncbi:MAG: NADH:flavin oxidoreductase, partial [Planctomycetota bacterium]